MPRRGVTTDPRKYITVRLQQLKEEREKNADSTAHLVLDKCIFELTEVLMLLDREADRGSPKKPLAVNADLELRSSLR